MVEICAALLAIVWLILPFILWAGLGALRRKSDATNKLLNAIVDEQLNLRKEAAATRSAAETLLLELKEARAVAERNAGKTLAFLKNIDLESEHANQLLQWMGQSGQSERASEEEIGKSEVGSEK
jgi:hypothetical protein